MIEPLPAPIAAYFAAETPAAIAACFTEDAVVIDERSTHNGRDEIRKWREGLAGISFTTEIVSVRGEGSDWTVGARVSGTFKGSPVMLDSVFRLSGDGIARLEIS